MKTPANLISKYNQAGPRYTSYPPVPFWKGMATQSEWMNHIKLQYDPEMGLDLYVHVPYCESLCYYCGCNRTITQNHSVEAPFVLAVIQEFNLYQEALGFEPKIHSLHIGGGTPTFLSGKSLRMLFAALIKNKTPNFIGSIEIDPRTCTKDHLLAMKEFGIERVSLGVQDFSPVVQKAIHREQSPELVQGLVNLLREMKFQSINFDLIYGLPEQTTETIAQTISLVREMKPDLVAFYSYAHLPEKIKNQRLIKSETLPQGEKKRELYEEGKELFLAAGYMDVGMDHFALPHSYLAQAKLSGRLHRNFMGYTDQKASVLIGLGPSAISDSGLSFMQNEKEVKHYYAQLELNQLPFVHGHVLTSTEAVAKKLILQLMCDDTTTFEPYSLPYTNVIEKELEEFKQDGLIIKQDNKISLTQLGKAFLRNIAMTFDYHLRESKRQHFSQTV